MRNDFNEVGLVNELDGFDVKEINIKHFHVKKNGNIQHKQAQSLIDDVNDKYKSVAVTQEEIKFIFEALV